MKKSILFGVALALVSTAATAQSSVQLFGVVDSALTYTRVSGKGSRLALDSSGSNSSIIGMKGTEDIGNGWSVNFWLESDFNAVNGAGASTDTMNSKATVTPLGTAIANRRSFVSVKSDQYGEIRLGRDYIGTFWNAALLDPFANVGFGAHGALMSYPIWGGSIYGRTSNSIFYVTPSNLGGFFGEVSHARGGYPSGMPNSADGNSYGVYFGYQGKSFKISAASQTTFYATGNILIRNIGGQFDVGFLRNVVLFQQTSREGSAPLMTSSVLVGGQTLSPTGSFRYSYVHLHVHDNASADASQIAGGYTYFLSKRTSLYTIVSYIANHKAAQFALMASPVTPTAGGNALGVAVGITHKF